MVQQKFNASAILLLVLFLQKYAAFRQDGGCLFPERWEGTWFQSGVRQSIIIEGSHLSNKGTCVASDGDKFLIVDDKRVCYRCVVIHEKHANVLQYKETFCHERETLPTLCRMITGDALLYSMFREGALPVPCPFRGPFTFTYNRGHGECRSPVSSIDVCTEDSRLLLSYQACPDVDGTESTVEELECLATWKEGSSRYLVGKVHHNHATSNEDRFRCFVYEKTVSSSIAQPSVQPNMIDDVDYRVAQSGDATCNGLASATEGSRTMTLRRAPTLSRCRFPHWLAGSTHWHTLDYSVTYSFHHRNSTLRITNGNGGGTNSETKVVCAQIRHSSANHESPVTILAHFTTNCESGYMCLMFHRRDLHVAEVQAGAYTRRSEDACSPPHFDRSQAKYITIVTTSPEPRPCPYIGKFAIKNLLQQNDFNGRSLHKRDWQRWRHLFSGGEFLRLNRRQKRVEQTSSATSSCASNDLQSLIIGCNNLDTMEFYTVCPTIEFISSYSCHGRWEENGTHYLITTPISRSSHGAKRYCFIYREEYQNGEKFKVNDVNIGEGGLKIRFSSSSRSCDRSIRAGVTGNLAFNITKTGKCIETSYAKKTECPVIIIFAILLYNIINWTVVYSKR